MPFLSLLLAAAPLGAPTDRAAAARAYADASGVTPPTHGARAECLGYWPAWVKP